MQFKGAFLSTSLSPCLSCFSLNILHVVVELWVLERNEGPPPRNCIQADTV